MSTVTTRPTNGVSYGIKHTITSTDDTDNTITFDFRVGGNAFRFDLVASVMWTSSAGVVIAPTGLTITYPAAGKVTVAGAFVAGQILHVIAQAVQP